MGKTLPQITFADIERELAKLPCSMRRPWSDVETAMLRRSIGTGVSSSTLSQQWGRWFGVHRTKHAIDCKRDAIK